MFLTGQKYRSRSPFPHVIIEDFFNDEDLTQCMESILNNIDNLEWMQKDYDFQVNKRWLEDPTKMPSEVKKFYGNYIHRNF